MRKENEYFTILDYLAHRKNDDCGYNFGRECDCSATDTLLRKLHEKGYVLTKRDTSAPITY